MLECSNVVEDDDLDGMGCGDQCPWMIKRSKLRRFEWRILIDRESPSTSTSWSRKMSSCGAGKAPREAPSGTDDAIADTTAGVSSTDGTGSEAVSLGTPQGNTVVGINTGIVDTGDLMNAFDGPADAMTATTAALEGFAVGAATAFATPIAIAAVAAVPVVGPAIAAGVVVTMAASTIYGLANGGAQAIHDSGSRLVQGQGMAQDYYLVAAVLGGIMGGGAVAPRGGGTTTFLHGTTTEAAGSVASGLRAVSTSTAPYPRGSFFTHAASERNALQAASHWPMVQGKAPSTGIRVVEMTVPNSTLDSLRSAGLVRTSSVPGTAAFPKQTVFLPEALPALNSSATFRIVSPSF